MNEQVAVQNLLRRKLVELQSRNALFSIRAFANRLGIQPSAVNEILKGHRRVSLKMAERLANQLQLDPSERAEFLGHFPARARRKKRLPETRALNHPTADTRRDVLRLTSDQFTVISDWVHFAVLNLVKTEGVQSDAEWMAARLKITQVRLTSALDRLSRLGLIERSENGNWRRTYSRVNTPDDVLSVSVQKSHLTDMDLARESLLHDPIHRRDFTSMTLAISPSLLPQAKQILRRAQDQLAALAAQERASEVYRLSSYLFPLSHPVSSSSPSIQPQESV